jgi:cell division septation protein DedD
MSRPNKFRQRAVDTPAVDETVTAVPVAVEAKVIDKPVEQIVKESAEEAAATAQVEHQGDRVVLTPVNATPVEAVTAAPVEPIAAEPALPDPSMTFASPTLRERAVDYSPETQVALNHMAGLAEQQFIERQAEYRRSFPTLSALTDRLRVEGKNQQFIMRITAKKAGFRRGGLEHPTSPVQHRALNFTPDQLEQLLTEPNLVVEIL